MAKGEKKLNVFLDASVLVAATLSREGGSFRAISESALRNIKLITSRYAYGEAERTIQEKYPENLIELHHLASFFTITTNPSEKFVESILPFIDFKDAPILAAALKEKADILVTLDRKHFLENQKIKEQFPFLKTLTPGDLIKEFFF